jgi:hypothetical protein
VIHLLYIYNDKKWAIYICSDGPVMGAVHWSFDRAKGLKR